MMVLNHIAGCAHYAEKWVKWLGQGSGYKGAKVSFPKVKGEVKVFHETESETAKDGQEISPRLTWTPTHRHSLAFEAENPVAIIYVSVGNAKINCLIQPVVSWCSRNIHA